MSFKVLRETFLVLSLLAFTIFAFSALAHAQAFAVVHTFTGTPDGSSPSQANVLDLNGTLLGTTSSGGTFGYGTIFMLGSAGKEIVLYNFTGGTDGASPNSGLVRDVKGNLYGTAQFGGDLSCFLFGLPGCGVVYKVSAGGVFSVLYTFTGGNDGAYPQGVILDTAGNLYGPTFFGGSLSSGVVYKLDSAGNETVLYNFTFGADGGEPNGFLSMDAAGNLYGATIGGGNLSHCKGGGCGVVFKIDTGGHESVLYTFAGPDGAIPSGALLMDSKGDLYGTTNFGGDPNCNNVSFFVGCGVVFKVTPAGTEKVLHTFTGPDGANPSYGLLRDSAGNLFSTTAYGGTANSGTIFEIDSKGVERVLHSFNGTTDGTLPYSGLTRDSKGNLYTNTIYGGDLSCTVGTTPGCGTVVKLVAPPEITVLSPTSGPVGTAVTISGVSLSQTTKVRFNGIAASFTVNSDTRVTATVPEGATTGKIGISSPGGSTQSPTSFTVTP